MDMHPVGGASGPSARQLFEILVREHADMLSAFLRSLVYDSAVVDDLFQETMMVAWRRLGESDQSLPFGPWLRGIAGKLVLEYRRKKANRGVLNCEPEVLQALEEEYRGLEKLPGDSFRDRAARLTGCLDKLPPMMRDVINLVYMRGLSLKSLAAAVDAAEETVKKRIQRARQMLADCLGGHA